MHCCWAQFWAGKELKEKRTLIVTKKVTTMLFSYTFCHIVSFFPGLPEKALGFWMCIVGSMKIGKEVEEKKNISHCKANPSMLPHNCPHIATHGIGVAIPSPCSGWHPMFGKESRKEDKNDIQPVRHCKVH